MLDTLGVAPFGDQLQVLLGVGSHLLVVRVYHLLTDGVQWLVDGGVLVIG